jgi:DNA-binding NarL/FixJ family response regulator
VAKTRKQGGKNQSAAKVQPTWNALLDDIAASDAPLVLETPSGARVVLVSEREFLNRGQSKGESPPPTPVATSTARLTKREIGILALVAEGKSGSQVATELSLAPNTVAQHLVSVRRKLGVSTTVAAIEVAKSSDLL